MVQTELQAKEVQESGDREEQGGGNLAVVGETGAFHSVKST